jgi:hypothetical protein
LKSIERVRTLERFSQHDSGGEESCHEFAAQ